MQQAKTNKVVINKRKLNGEDYAPYLFVAPVVLALVILVAYPLIQGVYISLFKTDLARNWEFVGMRNYLQTFTEGDFMGNLWITVKFTIIVVCGHFLVGTICALSLNNPLNKFSTVFRTILILPWLFPDVVISMIFKWILNPTYGLLNAFLLDIGAIERATSWLGNVNNAFITVCLICIWKGYPMVLVNMLAALKSVSEDVLEAAKVDGASKMQTFFCITLPSIKPVIATTVILDIVWWFKHYTMIELLTSGGPNNTTSVVSIGIYKQAFTFFNFGRASAMAVVVFFVCILISKGLRRVLLNDD